LDAPAKSPVAESSLVRRRLVVAAACAPAGGREVDAAAYYLADTLMTDTLRTSGYTAYAF
jgi:hypothetical protein